MDTTRFPQLVNQLYSLVKEFEAMFPGRHFTPDGHMVGSIGEAFAAYHYGLNLLTASTAGCDAVKEGKRIEVKATQGKRVAFRCASDYVLVLKIYEDGTFNEIYNGTGERIWARFRDKKLPSNGQHQISLAALGRLNQQVAPVERIERSKPV